MLYTGLKALIPPIIVVKPLAGLIILFGFSYGFIVWIWPVLKGIWAHPVGKVAITISHVLVLLLTSLVSRQLISETLGLPPKDFDLAHSVLTFFMYIPTWLLVLSIILAFVLQFSVFIPGSKLGPMKAMVHVAGAMMLAASIFKSIEFLADNEKPLQTAIKWIAVFTDYHSIPNYPGAKGKELVNHHANGVVSIARIKGWEVTIEVIDQQQTQESDVRTSTN